MVGKMQLLPLVILGIFILVSSSFAVNGLEVSEIVNNQGEIDHVQGGIQHVIPDSSIKDSLQQKVSHDDLGKSLPIWSIIPFIGILLSIAIFPLIAERFWHHNFGKISAFWGLLFTVPFLFAYQGEGMHEILHVYLLEYIPFIILLWSLYTIAGGILVKGAPVGIPINNLILLIIGTALASWIGTTGAAMVLVRPLIAMNKYRNSKVHLLVFFIFLVANIGGSLTPLGDPPLFLGFLQGVEFFWTFRLIPHMFFVTAILLTVFFVWDSYMFRKEGWHKKMHLIESHLDMPDDILDDLKIEEQVEIEDIVTHKKTTKTYEMEIKGLFNTLFLGGVITGVLFSGYVHLGEVLVFGIHIPIESIIRDLFLLSMGLLSLKFTSMNSEIRKGNNFNWFPILEVAKLFAAIFVTIIPALAMLKAGSEGQLSVVINSVKEPWHYFWITGALSSFLDNAPTYLVFLNTAMGNFNESVQWLMNQGEAYLTAISTGAVFFGAITYIGNAPNFMVKSIAEQSNIKMPSFFSYMIYSLIILGITFVLTTLVFF